MTEPDNVYQLREQVAQAEQALHLEGGGGPPYHGGMEERITRLEGILPTLATKGDVAEARLATKIDVAEAKSDIIKWLSGTVFAAVAIIVSVMAFMLSRIPATAPQAPIVIYAQPGTPPPPAKP